LDKHMPVVSTSATNSNLPVQVITIDGPSGAGKGTLSQLLAKRLGYHLLDSGALYRLVALAAHQQGIDLADEQKVSAIAAALDVRFDTTGQSTQTLLAGNDVTHAIRSEIVGMNASVVAAYPGVRSALFLRQRAFRQPPGLVADGRDMGTHVFTDANVKIFLTASAQARAERRYQQLLAKGEPVDMAMLVKDIEARDERDSTRAISPLRPAADAYVIDSTELDIEGVLNAMLKLVSAI
jgi:cytidylate kinase